MVKMVPHEAFACRCAEGDVVLRQSYKPESYGKLYYACPKSKPPKHFGCGFFLWKETRLRKLMSSTRAPSTPSYSAGLTTPPTYSSRPSTPPSYSSGPSTPTNYSLGSSRNVERSNCKHLHEKISVLKATMDMHMHPEQHTVNPAALFHEVLNEMKKLDLK
ncbi:RNA-directed DNA polymerase, eukaryota, reverse transcriptase zinc-binding domain protein [Tanacetum coccineum]